MRKLLVGLFLCVGTYANSADLPPQTLRDFSAGLVTSEDSAIIPDGAAQALQNVVTTDKRIEKRLGSLQVNSTALGGFTDQEARFLHQFVDNSGTFHLLAVSSNSLLNSTDGGSTWSILTSTHGITSSSRFQAANALGNCYLIDGSTHAIVYDGTSVTQNTAIPLGQAIEFYAGRLWVANGSTLYASRVLAEAGDDSDWTEDGVDDADATSATVRFNDGYNITALRVFGPDLFVFKARSIDRVVLRGDGLNFTLLPLTSHIGTVHPQSVVVADNAILWLGSDGYYGYDNSKLQRISENITPTINTVSQLSSLTRSFLETDFTTGTDDKTTAERVAGQVMLSTWTATDTSGADFAAGTLTNVTTQTVSGALYMSADNTNVDNNSFETGTGTDADNWTEGSWERDSSSCGTPPGGSFLMRFTPAFPISRAVIVYRIYRADGTQLATSGFSSSDSDCTFSQHTIPTATYEGQSIYLVFHEQDSNPANGLRSQTFIASNTNATFYIGFYDGGGTDYCLIDLVENGKSSVTEGSLVSQTFNTGMADPIWQDQTPTYTTNGQSVTFETQVSTDGATWGSLSTWTPGSAPTSDNEQYIRYKVSITTTSSGTGRAFVNDVTLSAVVKSGRHLSRDISLAGATAWLPFTATGDTNGGSIAYEIYVDTDTSIDVSDAGTFTSSQTITSGATPSLAIGNVVFVASTMTVSASGQDPSVQEWTLRWGEGAVSNLVTSVFYDQKYYSSVSVGGVDNDSILVFDRNGAWNIYKDLPAAYMMRYRDSILFGLENDGYVIRMEEPNTYQDYNGNAISCYWLSKDFDLGYPITDKKLLRYYLTGKYNADANVTFGYGVNRGSLTSASYPMTDSGFFREVIVPSSLTYSRGIQHRFRISDSTLDAPMAIDSVTGLWRLETAP